MDDAEHRKGLVLGGGGVAGIAWEYGLLAALLEAGIDLNGADVVVGTSAGSVVGAALRHGAVPGTYVQQREPVEPQVTYGDSFDAQALMSAFAAAQQAPDEVSARALLGEYALTVPQNQIPEAHRIAMIETQLASTDWPARTLRVTAVDAEDGAFVVYDGSSSVTLARAVMASCSVPGVSATMPIDGRMMMDGGMRSGTNADVADDCDQVLVIACNPEPETSATEPTLPQAAAQLEATGSVLVIQADDASRAAFGPNPLLLTSRPGSAAAGYEQGVRIAEEVARFWK